MANLMKASNQWATRPADERFQSLQEMYNKTLEQFNNSQEVTENLNDMQVIVGEDGNLKLVGKHSGNLNFSHWGFSQFCNNINSNARYMRTLVHEPERAAYNMNQDIVRGGSDLGRSILYVNNGRLLSSTSNKYSRLPNHIMTKAVMDLGADWRLLPARPVDSTDPKARPATIEDIGLSSRMEVGEMCVSSGAYANVENAFIFVVNEKMHIEDGSDGGLTLGFFAENSEVGERAFTLTTFLYRTVCANHIVWDVENIRKIRVKHIGGNMEARIKEALRTQISYYASEMLAQAEEMVNKAKNFNIALNFDDLVAELYARKELKLTKGIIEKAYATAEQYYQIDGNPLTAWGFSSGLTRYSQTTANQDERDALDKAAAKILTLATA